MRFLAFAAASVLVTTGCTRPVPMPVSPDGEIVRGDAGRRMDRYLEAAQHFGFSGAVLVADRAGIVLRKGYGPADAQRRVRPDMLFDMGSITKQFTAVAVLLLEEEGRLRTTDSLGKFFPQAPADKRVITIHQLLTHSSGLISDFAGDYDQVSPDSALRAIFNSPLVSPPGVQFNYSNAAFSLLATIIEQVTAETYDDFMARRIYRPVGMRSTGYIIRDLDSSSVARTYTPPVDHGTPAQRLARAGGPGWNLWGNGGVLTTVDDVYRYELALRAGRPMSRAVQSKQFATQFRRTPTLAIGYDWWIEDAGDDGVQFNRGGDGPPTGVSAEYRRYPVDSTAFILLANNRHQGGSTRRYIIPNLRQLYKGTRTLEPPLVRGAPASDLDRIVGTYVVDSTSYFIVERSGDHLSLSAVGQPAVNVMIFNRDTNSIRNRDRINERAANVIRALQGLDTAAMRSAFGQSADLARHASWWKGLESRLGLLSCMRVLGTDRLDRGVFMSTVQLRFARGERFVRWAWAGVTPVVSSEDYYLPGAFAFGAESPVRAGAWSPYWWLSGDSLVTYSLAFGSKLSAAIARGSKGRATELLFDVPGGTVRAVRGTPVSGCS